MSTKILHECSIHNNFKKAGIQLSKTEWLNKPQHTHTVKAHINEKSLPGKNKGDLWVKCGKTCRIPFYIKYQRWPQLRLEYKINRLMIAWGQKAPLLILLIFMVQALVMDKILNVPNRLTWWSLVPQMMVMLQEVLETRSQDLTRGNRSLGFLGDILVSGPFLIFLMFIMKMKKDISQNLLLPGYSSLTPFTTMELRNPPK